MAKRKDPENVIVEFFQDAQPDQARTMFRIVKGIVDKRALLGAKKKAARKAASQEPTSN